MSKDEIPKRFTLKYDTYVFEQISQRVLGWMVINLASVRRGGADSATSNPLFYISHSGKIVREICVPCMSETYAHTRRDRGRASEPPTPPPFYYIDETSRNPVIRI